MSHALGTRSPAVGGHAAGVPYDVTLNRGQALPGAVEGEPIGSTVVTYLPATATWNVRTRRALTPPARRFDVGFANALTVRRCTG